MAAGRTVGGALAVAGAVGLALLVAPAGAGAAPELPPVTAEELVGSVLAAQPAAFAGTVVLDNALGLPPLPQLPQAAGGTSTARVWSDGAGRGRLALPSDAGERTIVADGETLWAWDSAERTVVRAPHGDGTPPPEATMTDPTTAATQAVERLRASSVVTVVGTAEVAGRPAYELVLAPAPTERTLLREVRVAVDAERRVPLRLTVLATGSPEPAARIGFTDLEFAPQDPALFAFTPPPGATVEEREPHADGPRAGTGRPAPAIVGDGWDTVVLADLPARDAAGGEGPAAVLEGIGTPVAGPWGSGRLVTTAVGSAIVTDDGRVAAGAVPGQVLTEALAR